DTVEMKGEGFDVMIQEGQSVVRGQKLMSFSIDEIKKPRFRTTTAVIITNSSEYETIRILPEGEKLIEDVMFQVEG
ncbi:MAG: PTS glucose transporter subunit IIA, partial [Fibrobacter sp.]|nr:PTS glucose transporter subunit IIA [Fibrobacter sp.]